MQSYFFTHILTRLVSLCEAHNVPEKSMHIKVFTGMTCWSSTKIIKNFNTDRNKPWRSTIHAHSGNLGQTNWSYHLEIKQTIQIWQVVLKMAASIICKKVSNIQYSKAGIHFELHIRLHIGMACSHILCAIWHNLVITQQQTLSKVDLELITTASL